MSRNSVIEPERTLAPSEVVLLNGELFASKVLLGNVQLLHAEESVSAAQLGQAMLAVAVLANEAVGALSLETRAEKAMFGLRKVTKLVLAPTGKEIEWPAPSLEASVLRLARTLEAGHGDNDLHTVLYAWLGEDSASPWQSAITKVQEAMAARGLLAVVEEKRLKILTVTHYELPESTARIAAQQPVEPVKALLDSCQNARPDLWKLLEKQLKAAIKSRTEQDSDSGADF